MLGFVVRCTIIIDFREGGDGCFGWGRIIKCLVLGDRINENGRLYFFLVFSCIREI